METKTVQGRHNAVRSHGSQTKVRSLAVVGLGYVGLPLALLAEARGIKVHGFDIDENKTHALKKRSVSFLTEPEKQALKKSYIKFSNEENVLDGIDAYVICVPTPVDENHVPDLAPVIAAAQSVGRHLKKGGLVVIESTVNPGVCENIALPEIARESGLRVERDFFFAHCPERINPGDAAWNVRTIPRVMGAYGPRSLTHARALYRQLISADIVSMESIKEAEAVKMVENSFRDVNIAFVNELAMSFAKAGIDIMNVINGASSKPFSFMAHYPGCGVGGHCIPVDPYYLIRYGRENGFEHRFLATAREINNSMPIYTIDLLEKLLASLDRPIAKSTIALLGIAYKRDIPDVRESPALVIRDELERRGARVQSYDPFVKNQSTAENVDEALAGADAAVIATDHSAFSLLQPELFRTHGVPVVIDGRNCLDKNAFIAEGITYRGIGR
ncbi:MAG: nucleotide sugar dehydrogenase [Minisyncoccota bacterium]